MLMLSYQIGLILRIMNILHISLVRVQCISVLITSSYVDYIHTKKYCVIFSLTFVFSVIK